jgi:hypothetical protein
MTFRETIVPGSKHHTKRIMDTEQNFWMFIQVGCIEIIVIYKIKMYCISSKTKIKVCSVSRIA